MSLLQFMINSNKVNGGQQKKEHGTHEYKKNLRKRMPSLRQRKGCGDGTFTGSSSLAVNSRTEHQVSVPFIVLLNLACQDLSIYLYCYHPFLIFSMKFSLHYSFYYNTTFADKSHITHEKTTWRQTDKLNSRLKGRQERKKWKKNNLGYVWHFFLCLICVWAI